MSHKIAQKLKCLSLVVFGLYAGSNVLAQNDSTSRLVQDDVVEEKTKPSGPDADQILTNNQMRTASGSKSKWSIATGFNYSGGNLGSPFAEDRPNIAGATGATDKSLISSAVSAKYALTGNKALFAGVGVRWLTPFQGTSMPHNYPGDKFDVDNPYLNYQYLYKVGELESAVMFSSTYFTDTNLVSLGYLTSLGLSQNSIYKIPRTNLSIGTSAYTGLGFYTKNDAKSKAAQSDYSWGFLPFVEYQITQRLNFRTSWNLWIFEHIRSQSDPNTYNWDKVSQTVGFGISVTRDFFLYPNIQFLPDDTRTDRTTVALSTNLNIF